MTVDYSAFGAHYINMWLWSKLKDFEYKSGVKAFGDYADSGNLAGFSIVPIIPSQQKPQIFTITEDKKSPFIVYSYNVNPYSSDWWLCREQCVYIIYDPDEERLRAIHGYMTDLLKRVDWTARNINDSNVVSPSFDFKYVVVTSAVGPDAYEEEGGEQSAIIVINYEYTTNLNSQDGNGMRV